LADTRDSLSDVAEYLQVSTTTDNLDAAKTLAGSAVRARLAASAQVFGPATSVFWHLGKLGSGEEWLIILKTTVERYRALEAHLIEHHPWDNPEVSAVELVAGSGPYLDWVSRATADPA
jgi:periplasmic divalent cation tolerance protein